MIREDPKVLRMLRRYVRPSRVDPIGAGPTVDEIAAITSRSWPIHGPIVPAVLR